MYHLQNVERGWHGMVASEKLEMEVKSFTLGATLLYITKSCVILMSKCYRLYFAPVEMLPPK